MARDRTLIVFAAAVSLAFAGCQEVPAAADSGGEGDTFDARPDADRGEGAVDGETAPSAGPVTVVATELEVTTERRCDLDGDGDLDNAVADLGPAHAAMFAAALGTLLEGQNTGILRPAFHLPWVEDLAGPNATDATVIALLVADTDLPPDPTDDFSGEEPFSVLPFSMDGCGQPAYAATTDVTDGDFEATSGALAFPFSDEPIVFSGAQLTGHVEPYGTAARIDVCSYLTARTLGGISVSEELPGATLLGTFLLGGAAFGLSGIPGVTPDVDVDGDGLERFVVTEEGSIESCIDGDRTVVEGRDCWLDERFADGFSTNFSVSGVPALLAGPRPSWRWELEGECEFPPEEPAGLWGRCASGACERWGERSCTPSCGGGGVQRCPWDCSSWGACIPSGQDAMRPSACDRVVVEGAASCDAASGAVLLVDGTNELSAVRLPEPIVLGDGPVTVEAAVHASEGTTELPGFGWGIIVALGDDSPWLASSEPMWRDWGAIGYSLEWQHTRDPTEGNEDDKVSLRFWLGPGDERNGESLSSKTGGPVGPSLDSTTEGSVVQHLRLVIVPDIPGTEENEQIVAGQMVTDSETRTFDMACHGLTCPVPLRSGDAVGVGVVAGAAADDSVMTLELSEGGLEVLVEGLCP